MTRVLSRKKLFDGKIFSVEQREIFAELHNPIMRQIVLHDPVVLIVAINNQGDVILTHEYRAGVNNVTYGIPAGFINHGETAIEAAKRELTEETGFIATDATLMSKVSSSEGFTNEKANLVLVHYGKKNVGTHFDSDELVHVQTVPFEKLLDMVFDNEIKAGNAVAAILLAKHYLNN